MTERWTETEIAAWLDGELPQEDRDRVGRLIVTDPEAGIVAERLRRNDALLRDAFAAPLEEEVPPRLATAMREPPPVRVVRLADRQGAAWRPAAMAAGLALVLGFGVGAALNFGRGVEIADGLAVGVAPERVATALETAPSGETLGEVRPLASFETGSEGICREFETLGPGGAPAGHGLACRNAEGGWRVLVAADIAPQTASDSAGGFAPAGGAAIDVTSSALDAIDAGPALTPEAENAAIARDWSR